MAGGFSIMGGSFKRVFYNGMGFSIMGGGFKGVFYNAQWATGWTLVKKSQSQIHSRLLSI